jgi:predicted N-formylglutamate amidohydrolase
MEDEFWTKNGKPKFITPHQVPSFRPGNEGKMRDSFIAIVLDKDNRVSKLDELKE